MKIKVHNIVTHESHLISIHMQQQWWGCLVYKKNVAKKVQLNFWLIICHKNGRGASQVEIVCLFFFKSECFFLEIIAFYNFTGLGKTKEDDVPQNDCEKDASTEPMAGNVIVCFLS